MLIEFCKSLSDVERQDENKYDRLLVPLNFRGHMIFEGYEITRDLLKAFERRCGPGYCGELTAMINNKLDPMTIIGLMGLIADFEDLNNAWQKTQKGSVDNLICGIGKFEYYVNELGPYCFYSTYNIIDRKVWIEGHVPSQFEWDCMSGIADLLVDCDSCWNGRIRPERCWRRTAVPDQEDWTQICKGKLLYPSKTKKDKWDVAISEGVDVDEWGPQATGSNPVQEDEIHLDRHLCTPQMPPLFPLPNPDRHISRSPSPSINSEPRSYQFADMPAQESSRYLHPPKTRSPSVELPSGRFHENERAGHSHSRNRSQGECGSPSPEECCRGRHHDKNSTNSSSKRGQKKGEMYLWRKHGKTGLSFRRE